MVHYGPRVASQKEKEGSVSCHAVAFWEVRGSYSQNDDVAPAMKPGDYLRTFGRSLSDLPTLAANNYCSRLHAMPLSDIS